MFKMCTLTRAVLKNNLNLAVDGVSPVVLSREEVKRLLEAAHNLKHRLILSLTYSAGLRVSEPAGLKIQDIDLDRQILHLKAAKGKKDRTTLLSVEAGKMIPEYLSGYQPKTWLFEGTEPGKRISTRTVQKIFEQTRRDAKIENRRVFIVLGTVSPIICWKTERIFGLSRNSRGMLPVKPPKFTPT